MRDERNGPQYCSYPLKACSLPGKVHDQHREIMNSRMIYEGLMQSLFVNAKRKFTATFMNALVQS